MSPTPNAFVVSVKRYGSGDFGNFRQFAPPLKSWPSCAISDPLGSYVGSKWWCQLTLSYPLYRSQFRALGEEFWQWTFSRILPCKYSPKNTLLLHNHLIISCDLFSSMFYCMGVTGTLPNRYLFRTLGTWIVHWELGDSYRWVASLPIALSVPNCVILWPMRGL